MFYVHGVGLERTPYVPNVWRSNREVTQVDSVSPIHEEVREDNHYSEQFGTARDRYSLRGYNKLAQSGIPRREVKLASELMSRNVSVTQADRSLDSVWKIMDQSRIRHLPVMDSANQLIGIISDRDILKFSSGFISKGLKSTKNIFATKVADIMNSRVLVATPETEVREVARCMFQERVGCMPIVNQDGLLLGIMTRSDILRALVVQAPLEIWS